MKPKVNLAESKAMTRAMARNVANGQMASVWRRREPDNSIHRPLRLKPSFTLLEKGKKVKCSSKEIAIDLPRLFMIA
jgi:hypothetical protein